MEVRKGYKFKLKISKSKEAILRRYCGCARLIWNKTLDLNLRRLNKKHKIMYYQESNFFLQLWKQSEDYNFLKECPSQVLQQKLQDLERAFKDGFDKNQPRKRIPKFKSRGVNENIRFPQGFKLRGNQIFLPKLGWLGFKRSRLIKGKPKNVTVSYQAGKWYVSIQTEESIDIPRHPSASIVGIDMGIKKFAALSTGEYYEPKNSFKILSKLLKRAQRSLSRKVKFSINWKKQKLEVQKIHAKIANVRRDHLHKCSTEISKNHAMIVMEDLKVSNMSKSSKGDIENPGKNVKAKSGLNKSILDQGWYEFRRQITYKQLWRGGDVLLVPPKNTSITCPQEDCRHIAKSNRETQSIFRCEKCGYNANADYVGALNVLRVGQTRLACGDFGNVCCQAQESPRVVA